MSRNSRSVRRLQVENLECRALMTAMPIGPTLAGQSSAARPEAAAIISTAVVLPSAEEEGLNSAELATLNQLAGRGVFAYETANDAPPAYVDKGGSLIIHGCKGSDFVNVVTGGKDGVVRLSHAVDGQWNEYGTKFSGVKKIIFLGYDGQNEFHNQTSLPSEALGGNDVDKFFGGSNADIFFGLAGNDELKGYLGSDQLFGGTGCDYLEAGTGENGEMAATNVLKGGRNNDYLVGGIGWDEAYGNSGDDILIDSFGHGTLNGGKGKDKLFILDYAKRADSVAKMRGEADDDILVVKKGIYGYYRWLQDDYQDDAIFAASGSARELSRKDVDNLFHIKNWKKDV